MWIDMNRLKYYLSLFMLMLFTRPHRWEFEKNKLREKYLMDDAHHE